MPSSLSTRDRAVVGLGNRLHDREAEAAATRAVSRARAIEAVEDVWQRLVGDAVSLVAHLEHETAPPRTGGERHLRAVRGVAKRILDEVVEQEADVRAHA